MKYESSFYGRHQKGRWLWIGWVEEIPGVNSQGKTRAELQKNLRSALKEALEFNRNEALWLLSKLPKFKLKS